MGGAGWGRGGGCSQMNIKNKTLKYQKPVERFPFSQEFFHVFLFSPPLTASLSRFFLRAHDQHAVIVWRLPPPTPPSSPVLLESCRLGPFDSSSLTCNFLFIFTVKVSRKNLLSSASQELVILDTNIWVVAKIIPDVSSPWSDPSAGLRWTGPHPDHEEPQTQTGSLRLLNRPSLSVSTFYGLSSILLLYMSLPTWWGAGGEGGEEFCVKTQVSVDNGSKLHFLLK